MDRLPYRKNIFDNINMPKEQKICKGFTLIVFDFSNYRVIFSHKV